MDLGAISQQFLKEVEAATGLPVQVQSDARREALKRARTLDPHGPIRDLADAALNRVADSNLSRNADGVNPEALEAMIAAIKHLRSMPPEAVQKLAVQAALIGQNGLRLKDPNPVHQLEGILQPLTGLEVACLIHAGVQRSSPGTETGFPFEAEFAVARRHNGSDAGWPHRCVTHPIEEVSRFDDHHEHPAPSRIDGISKRIGTIGALRAEVFSRRCPHQSHPHADGAGCGSGGGSARLWES